VLYVSDEVWFLKFLTEVLVGPDLCYIICSNTGKWNVELLSCLCFTLAVMLAVKRMLTQCYAFEYGRDIWNFDMEWGKSF
jgi:hypothetical protein